MLVGTRRIISVLCWFAFVLATISTTEGVAWAQIQPSGGLLDSATSNGLRPMLSAGEIQAFLPQRGTFTFPSPYSTTGIRLTNASDCGGQDCVTSVGYSYWSNINNHVGSDTMLVFLGLERRKGGGGPTLFSYNKKTGETKNLGPLFSPDSPYSWSTGEGWYFSASQPNTLYMNDGPRMLRYDVMTHAMSEVYNVETILGSGRIIWQMHSSDDDRVHSATVRDSSSYAMLGCIAYESGVTPTYVAAKGDYDECQIDKSGRYLVVKENVDGLDGEDNRIIDRQTGAETLFLDRDGAAGHSGTATWWRKTTSIRRLARLASGSLGRICTPRDRAGSYTRSRHGRQGSGTSLTGMRSPGIRRGRWRASAVRPARAWRA